MDTYPKHRGIYYGAFAYAVMILTCYGGIPFMNHFYWPEWSVPVVFLLGAVYTVTGVLHHDCLDGASPRGVLAYFIFQCVLLGLMVYFCPVRGFFCMIVLPTAAQTIFDLRPRHAVPVCLYLFSLTVLQLGLPVTGQTLVIAVLNYGAAFAFTITFTFITKQALDFQKREEKLRLEIEAANVQLRAQAAQADELATTRERNRLAREIHDGVGHYLTVVKTQLDAASALLPAQPDRARDAVGKAAKLAAEALDDVRRSVGALRTDAARPPLPEALKELAAHGEPAPTLAIEGQPRPLAPGVEHALYRAAQEGLTNIRKHARATNALVRLDFRTPQRVVLELADNGIGTAADPGASGFGLRGLRERIELLGGTVDSGNRLEGGFALRVEVPA